MSDAPATDQPHAIVDEEEAPKTQLEQEQAEAAAELSAPTKNGELVMDVKVHSPFKEYYNGPAFSVSAENLTGPFDILPRHHNFITLLSPCDVIVRSNKGDEKIQISGGIMHVKADKIIVFLDV